jgi:uncharacterized protein (TIGR02145 family)
MKNKIIFLLNFLFLTTTIFITGCEETEEPTPALETGTVTDVSGNEYKTVKIGNQWWMAENLRVKTFRNGNLIPEKDTDQEWANAIEGWCLYPTTNLVPPGLLYNYYTVTSSNGLAPAGWHIPTDDDWKQLEKHLGMSEAEANKLSWRGTTEGDALKPAGPEGWSEYENVWGSNSSGFTALAGSCRLPDGRPGEPGLKFTGFWWTASEHSTEDAYYRYLDYKNSNIFRSHTFKNYGFSVRCVKD